jgi:dephospho-CoA kinase
MIVIGLTGGIGMGKSTLAAQLASLGAEICSADAIVHKLLGKGGAAVKVVGKAFPGVVEKGVVDRRALGEIVFHNKTKLETLEKILHPLVVAEENAFVEKHRRKGTKFAVLEIPLLFETGAQKRCDVVILASAPAAVQKERVLKRPGMTKNIFKRIVAAQMPEGKKRKRADYVVLTGKSKADSLKSIKEILRKLL